MAGGEGGLGPAAGVDRHVVVEHHRLLGLLRLLCVLLRPAPCGGEEARACHAACFGAVARLAATSDDVGVLQSAAECLRAAEKRVFSSASFATAASFFPKDFSSASGVFAGTDVSGVAAGVAATSAEGRPGVVPAPRAEAAAARASSLERREPDADLPALRVVGPRDDGCEPSPRVDASGAGVFAFAAFAAEASSFPATEAGEIRSISMTSASGPSRRAPSRDTEAGLVFLSLA